MKNAMGNRASHATGLTNLEYMSNPRRMGMTNHTFLLPIISTVTAGLM
jgi:hypothetical protein